MRAIALFAVLAFVPPDRPDPNPKDKAKPIQEQILGDWQLVKMVVGGDKDRKQFGPTVLTFTAKEIIITENGKRQDPDNADYTLDVTKKPIALDIQPKRGGERKIEGILKVEGEELTICFAHGGRGNRPLEFASPANSEVALMQLKRVKK